MPDARALDLSEQSHAAAESTADDRSARTRMARASLASIALTVGLRLVSLGRAIVLARILSPADLGGFAFVAAVVGVIELSSGHGVRDYIVASRSPTEGLTQTVWTVLVARGLALSILLVLLVVPLSSVLGGGSLQPIFLWMSFGPAIKGLASMSIVAAQRNLTVWPTLAISTLGQMAEAGVSIGAAYVLRSGVGLAIGITVAAAIQVLASYFVRGFAPRLRFRRSELREVLRFGRWRFASSAAWYVSTSGDDVLLGWLSGSYVLGVYKMAWNFANLPSTFVTGALDVTMFPNLALHARQSPEALARVYERYLSIVFAVLAPIVAVLVLAARPLVCVILGVQWSAAAAPLAVLAVSSLFRAAAATGGQLFLASNRPGLDFAVQISRATTLVIALLLLVHPFGAVGAASASLCSICVSVVIWLLGLRRLTVPLRVVRRAAAAGAATGCCAGLPILLMFRGLGQGDAAVVIGVALSALISSVTLCRTRLSLVRACFSGLTRVTRGLVPRVRRRDSSYFVEPLEGD